MTTIYLIHWNKAEAETLVEEVRGGGWEIAGLESEDGARAGKQVVANPPDILLIYLTRLPSHGRETAAYIHSLKATRDLPIVFVGGKDEAVARVQEKVPGGIFIQQEDLQDTLQRLSSKLTSG